jgi:hypothetical protein
MAVKLKILSILFLLFHLSASAQEKGNRILILLDGSSSMQEQWSKDQTRFKAASNVIIRLMDSIYQLNNEVEFGLRVYGHQYPAQDNNCFDTKQEVMFSRDNLTQMTLRLESLHPYGISPIAYSLREAAENDLVDPQHYNYSIILISDGGESCNGNICAVAKELLEKKIIFKPYIISLVEYAPLREQYACLGNYLQTSDENEVRSTIEIITSAYKRVIPIIVKQKIIKTIEQPEASATVQPKKNIDLLGLRPNKNIMVLTEFPNPKKIEISNLDTSLEHGYAKFIDASSEAYLFYQSKGEFRYYRIVSLNEIKTSKRIRLPVGKYKAVFNKKTALYGTETFKEFVVKDKMITEVFL